MQQIERGKIVDPSRVVALALAGAEQDAGIETHRGLGNLHIETLGMQGDLARHSDAALIGSKIVSAGNKAEQRGKPLELPACLSMELPLRVRVVGHGLPEIEPGF